MYAGSPCTPTHDSGARTDVRSKCALNRISVATMLFGRQTWVGFILIISVIVYEFYYPEERQSEVVQWLGRVWASCLTESPSQQSRIALGYVTVHASVV